MSLPPINIFVRRASVLFFEREFGNPLCIIQRRAHAIGEVEAPSLRDVDTGGVAAGLVGAPVVQEGAVADSHLGPSCRNGGKSLPCNRM